MRFSNSGGGEKAAAGQKKSSASQTRWELKDKEVQVPSCFEAHLVQISLIMGLRCCQKTLTMVMGTSGQIGGGRVLSTMAHRCFLSKLFKS